MNLRRRIEELEARAPKREAPVQKLPNPKALLAKLSAVSKKCQRKRLKEAYYRQRTPIADQLKEAKRKEAEAIARRDELRARALPEVNQPEYWDRRSALSSAEFSAITAAWWREQVEDTAKGGRPTYWWAVYRDNDRELIRRADGWKRPLGETLCETCKWNDKDSPDGAYCVNRMEFALDRDECYCYQPGRYGTAPGTT